MKKRKKTFKRKKLFRVIIIIVLISILIYSLINIFTWQIDNQKTKEIEKSLIDKVEIVEVKENIENVNEPENKNDIYWKYKDVSLISVDINKLKEENADTVGWLQVTGTNINYPIVQSSNNDYYLNKDYLNRQNASGWIYLDYRNNLDELNTNNIIYGHSRTSGTMFGTLKKVLSTDWLNNIDNHTIKVSSTKYNYLFQVFSIYTITSESYYLNTKFNNPANLEKFITTLKDRSTYNFNTSVTSNDKILTLSTCHNDSDRLVVHAKLIKQSTK